jgi:2-amino-4-hydroxy-6-hydroxymethyldihydropteridine diphosphokinase
MPRCYIALGSNLSDPLQQLNSALPKLADLAGTQLATVSPWYCSKAVGPGQQPDYLNGVAELHTQLDAHSLLQGLHEIEASQQRQRIEHWGPRTLDLDLLLYGNDVIEDEILTVPHPRMLERNFVLYPLYNIAPDLRLPDGTSLKSRLDCCPMDELTVQPRQ